MINYSTVHDLIVKEYKEKANTVENRKALENAMNNYLQKKFNCHCTVEPHPEKLDEVIINIKEGAKIMEEMVTITKDEYESLIEDSKKLNALEIMGVDNWCGYGDAMEYLNGEEE